MKLVAIVLSNGEANQVVEALVAEGYRVTRLASTGGLLRQGNTTLITGVADEAVSRVLDLVQGKVSGARAIVLPLERYEHF